MLKNITHISLVLFIAFSSISCRSEFIDDREIVFTAIQKGAQFPDEFYILDDGDFAYRHTSGFSTSAYYGVLSLETEGKIVLKYHDTAKTYLELDFPEFITIKNKDTLLTLVDDREIILSITQGDESTIKSYDNGNN